MASMTFEVEAVPGEPGKRATAVAVELAGRFFAPFGHPIARGTAEAALWLAYVQGRADERATADLDKSPS